MSRTERTWTGSIGIGLWLGGWVALALCGSAAPASAVSLADLLDGGSIVSGEVEFSDFEAKMFGKGLSRDYSEYDVQADSDGAIIVTLAEGTRPGKHGKLKLSYQADSIDPEDLSGAFLSVDADSGVNLRANKKIKASGVGTLFARNALGKDFDDATLKKLFDDLDVRLSIRSRHGLGAVTAGFTTRESTQVPEPNTAALIAAGLLGIGVVRSRRWGSRIA